MTNLKEQLHTDLTAAIKAKDSLTSGTLRMVLSAITNEEVSGKEVDELMKDCDDYLKRLKELRVEIERRAEERTNP